MASKSVLQLLPFLGSCGVYFYLEAYDHHGQAWSTVLKCLPIYALAFFVYLQRPSGRPQEVTYQSNILIGLLISSIGDALLNLDYFIAGMVTFAVAHVFYIKGFGWHPKHPIIGVILYAIAFLCLTMFYQNLPLDLKIGMPIYATFLCTTCWRAIARARDTLPSKLAAIGTVVFVISDSLIAFDMFYASIPNVQFMILLTYYVAQFGIAASVLDKDVPKHR